jgi:hypothetical protein
MCRPKEREVSGRPNLWLKGTYQRDRDDIHFVLWIKYLRSYYRYHSYTSDLCITSQVRMISAPDRMGFVGWRHRLIL